MMKYMLKRKSCLCACIFSSPHGSPSGIKRESGSPLSSNGMHHHMRNYRMDRNGEGLSALMKREVDMSESGHYGGGSSDGDSMGRDDPDDLLSIERHDSMDKHEDLAEDLSFSSSSHTVDSRMETSRFEQ
jgi:hypothetical protein